MNHGFDSEAKLVAQLVVVLRERGYFVSTEIPNMGQSVDLVASKGSRLILFEAKLHDWRRAVRQCRAHKVVADAVFVVLPTRDLSQELLDAIQSEGLGLVLCDAGTKSCSLRIRPSLNGNRWEPQRGAFKRSLELIVHGN